eukprot:TRINITY_DN67750_c0_g1_i1.p1 TRINITY_DN67750_c0_g1~~TRINITY_DN67750_c0_g1_i1.p1  ORF type:complete len:652 (-),score=98.76 TRINITY_DN67750_c0_g1_i1:117-2072(-)
MLDDTATPVRASRGCLRSSSYSPTRRKVRIDDGSRTGQAISTSSDMKERVQAIEEALVEFRARVLADLSSSMQAAHKEIVEEVGARLFQNLIGDENLTLAHSLFSEKKKIKTVMLPPEPVSFEKDRVQAWCLKSKGQAGTVTDTAKPTARLTKQKSEQSIEPPNLAPGTPKIRRRSTRNSTHLIGTDTQRDSGFYTSKKTGNRVFPDKTEMTVRIQEAMLEPAYDVTDFYHTTGVCRKIATSMAFDRISLVVIAMNAVWLGFDLDKNQGRPMWESHPVFVVGENMFCAYFLLEVLIRFFAFEQKKNCLRDPSFVFDGTLAALMVFETWVINVALWLSRESAGSLGDLLIVRIFRVLRLTRSARLARLMQAVPEIMIMVKAMLAAVRSVMSTCVLLAIIVYVFAISFRSFTMDLPIGQKYFPSVLTSMASLLLLGALPDTAEFIYTLKASHILFAVAGLAFVLVATLTLLNMLIGVLVQVVLVVAEGEKEALSADFVKKSLTHVLRLGDEDKDNCISKEEFEAMIVQPQAVSVLQEVGVDVLGLVGLTDFIFQGMGDLPLEDFFKLVLQFRGTNGATVKDIVDIRRFIVQELQMLECSLMQKFSTSIDEVRHRLGPKRHFFGGLDRGSCLLDEGKLVNGELPGALPFPLNLS